MPVSGELSQKAWEVDARQSWGETFGFSWGSLIIGYLCPMKVIPTWGLGTWEKAKKMECFEAKRGSFPLFGMCWLEEENSRRKSIILQPSSIGNGEMVSRWKIGTKSGEGKILTEAVFLKKVQLI